MTAWKKPKRDAAGAAYAVYPVVGTRYGVGLFRVGEREPERVGSVSLRSTEDRLQKVVDRMNSRIGVTRDAAVAILAAWRREHAK